MIMAKTSAIGPQLVFLTVVLAVLAYRPALAQCGGGGMSCGGHSMSSRGMGHANHLSGPSYGHSSGGHASGTTHWNHIGNQPVGARAPGNGVLSGGHGAHVGAGGPHGTSPGWSSPSSRFRSASPRSFSGVAEPTIHSRTSTAFNTSLPGHVMSHGNDMHSSAGRFARGVDDRATVALPRLQRAISSSSLLPRLPSSGSDGIRFDNHSAHQPHRGLTLDSSPDWAAKLRETQSDSSLPGFLGLRSQTRSNQTTLATSRLRSLDSSHTSHSRPNANAKSEEGDPPTNDWMLGGASDPRPVFRPSLDRYSAVELPATRGLEEFLAQSRIVPTTQPRNGPSNQAAR